MFQIIIRGWNIHNYIDDCMRSLLTQTRKDWRAVIVLDFCEDGSLGAAMQYKSPNVQVHMNDKRYGLAHNIVRGIDLAKPEDEDVICMLDGDDYLEHSGALEKIHNKYQTNNCLVTYGSYISDATRMRGKICKAYPPHANVRTFKWRASHLKTFKFKVYKQLPIYYFQHNGMFIPCASDVALMLPLIECAGIENTVFCKEPIYHYRNTTPYNVERKPQKKWEAIVREKRPMRRMF